MPTAVIDGISTTYEVIGTGPPLLMCSPGGFDAAMSKWRTLEIYRETRILERLAERYGCIVYDRRESGTSGGRVERITWAHYVAQAKGLLDHLGIDR
ncbi:MAG TPA: alpha/beta hydrolase, partial [Actinomycetota bacterium]|nr:alpha/beta hydrolase [Actinomycetota bacterium]